VRVVVRMRNYKNLISMLKRANVAFTEKRDVCGEREVHIPAGFGSSNEGETGLYTRLVFAPKGQLLYVGVWSSACKLS
jgi:hypothetical protein